MLTIKDTTVIDLTHQVTATTPAWDLSCGYHVKTLHDYSDGDGSFTVRVQRIEIIAATGTHMDAPAHFIPHGKDVADLPLQDLVAPGVVIDVSKNIHEGYTISLNDVVAFEQAHGSLCAGDFVLFYTGWSRYWHEPKLYKNEGLFPCVAEEVACYLLEKKIVGIGIDTFSPDRPSDGFHFHQAWLGSGHYIVENVAHMHLLPTRGFTIFVVPLKLQGATESPVRLFAMVEKNK